MTGLATAPRRRVTPQPDGFGWLLRAEWTKFVTVRGWVIGMIVAAALIDLFGLLLTGSIMIACRNGTGRACLPAVPLGPGGEPVSDSYYLVRQPLGRSGTITVRMTSLTGGYLSHPVQAGQSPAAAMQPGVEPWSKAGIIITASTRPGAAYAAMMVTGGHGVRMQYDYTGDVAGRAGRVSAARPRWLRLARSGDAITGYESADGSHWTAVGTAHLAGLPGTVQAGLFAASPGHVTITPFFGGNEGRGGPSVATGAFDHVQVSGGRAGGAQGKQSAGARWAGTAIDPGARTGPGIVALEGFRQAGGVTVTGTGDIAPVVHGLGDGFPTATFEEHLVGTFAGLIAVAVIGAMFMTAEYRRGLIRLTLAATPRRGRVLAAKAIVIGSVTFVAGLAASIVAVTVGAVLSRNQGAYVLPVSWATEVRAVAGTALLLAVAAVLALAVGTAARRSAAAITAVIVAIVLPYILAVASVLQAGAADWLLRVTPAAAFAIQQTTPQYSQVTAAYAPADGYFPLAPWAGLAVLCGYAALALAAAAWLLRRRDA